VPSPKLAIGVPFFGQQPADWWAQLAILTGTLHRIGVDFQGVIAAGSMMTDSNRNQIARDFLATKADWLFWLDTDNMVHTGAIKRLLDMGKTLASGVYYLKREPYSPVAYYRKETDGGYYPATDWERGEIIPVDATGCGCLLSHRSVYEDMQAAFTVYQDARLGWRLVHKDDVQGDVPAGASSVTDGKLIDGVLYERLRPLTVTPSAFPWFVLEHGRTEDMLFFENAARVGHKPWLDTSIEAGHLRLTTVTGEVSRKYRYKLAEKELVIVPQIPSTSQAEVIRANHTD
jgi:hypothetical protein